MAPSGTDPQPTGEAASVPESNIGPASGSDAQEAHLFLCLGTGHYAVSNDPSGENLPKEACNEGWKYVQAFALGVREPVPIGVDPEPIIRALRDDGFYVLGNGTRPHGTAQ
jgi:hypothetical protein